MRAYLIAPVLAVCMAWVASFDSDAISQPVGEILAGTVKKVLNVPQGAAAVLTGHIIARVPDEKNRFIFRDETGEMEVKIGRDVFGRQNVTTEDLTRISGRVALERGQPYINVKKLVLLKDRLAHAPVTPVPVWEILAGTVKKVFNVPQGAAAVLTGHITARVPGEKNRFIFRDDTGEISVEIARDVFGGLTVAREDLTRISGTVMRNNGQPLVNVKKLVVLKADE